jgi:multidrug efflux system membrane fusion protein
MAEFLRIWKSMKPRYQWAIGIALVVTAWLATGLILHPHHAANDDGAQAKTSDVPTVKVRTLIASNRDATLTVHGRTQALHEVDVRAEVEGVVQAIRFEKGDHVRTGQVLCEIKANDRSAKLDMAQALVAQRDKEYDVAQKLFADGFRSKTQMAQAQAALQASRAEQRTQQIELDNTRIKAPFDGVVDNRYVDVGDYMRPGDKCAMLIAPTPFLAVGSLSENEVAQATVGDPATVTLVTGETVQGKIRFIANMTDPTTRTFRIEVELPNPDGKLRDGISADIHIPVKQLKAQHISPGILVLDDTGVVGVRAVDGSTVRFIPVQIVSDGPDGMWVAGLPNNVTVITVGQEFVNNGEHVQTVPDTNNGTPS